MAADSSLGAAEERVLCGIFDLAGANRTAIVNAGAAADEFGLPRGEVFRIVEYLSSSALLEYRGAGPRVCLTERGARYVQKIRDPAEAGDVALNE